MSDNINVAIRIRPLLKGEKSSLWTTCNANQIIQVDRPDNNFCFDRVFSEDDNNSIVYSSTCHPIVDSVMKGFNGTIFAYGQTSSGKTYTMLHKDGIIPQAIEDIFLAIENMPEHEFLIRVSYMEIYNENVTDLLTDDNKILKVQEDTEGVTNVIGIKEVEVKSINDLFDTMKVGEGKRRSAETQANQKSSRSHAIFRVIIESRPRYTEDDNAAVTVAQLNLVDLAGSEKASASAGDRFREGVSINKSLMMLSQVIHQLSEEKNFVSYRDSKLTRILKNSLGGNAHTVVICTIAPASLEQSQSTLQFAMRAKRIKNKVTLNVVALDKALFSKYQNEIRDLTKKLKALEGQQHPGNLEKQLQEREKQNASLRQQIHEMKEKFICSQSSTPVTANRKVRRETLCMGHLLKMSKPTQLNVSFFQPLPSLQEEAFCDSDSITSSGHKTFADSSYERSFSNCVDASVQTEEVPNKYEASLKQALLKVASVTTIKNKWLKEYWELRQFIKLERQITEEIKQEIVEEQNLPDCNVATQSSDPFPVTYEEIPVPEHTKLCTEEACTSTDSSILETVSQVCTVDRSTSTVSFPTFANDCSSERALEVSKIIDSVDAKVASLFQSFRNMDTPCSVIVNEIEGLLKAGILEEEFQKSFEASSRQVQALKQLVESQQGQLKKKDEERALINLKIREETEKLSRNDQMIQKLREKFNQGIEHLKSEKEIYRAKWSKANEDKAILMKALNERDEYIAKLKYNASVMKTSIQKYEVSVGAYRGHIYSLLEKCKELKSKLDDTCANAKKKMNKMQQDFENEKSAMKNDSEAIITQLKHQHCEQLTEQRKVVFQETAESWKRDLSSREDFEQELRAELDEELRRQKEEYDALKRNLQQAQDGQVLLQMAKKDSQIEKLEGELSQMLEQSRVHAANKDDEIEQLNKKCSEMAETVEELKMLHKSELQAQLVNSERLVLDALEDKNSLASQLQKLEGDNVSLQNKIQELSRSSSSSNRVMNNQSGDDQCVVSLSYENRQLKERIKQGQADRELLMKKLSTANNELRRLHQQFNDSRLCFQEKPIQKQIVASGEYIMPGSGTVHNICADELQRQLEHKDKLLQDKNKYTEMLLREIKKYKEHVKQCQCDHRIPKMQKMSENVNPDDTKKPDVESKKQPAFNDADCKMQ